jgi:hypothetical protein
LLVVLPPHPVLAARAIHGATSHDRYDMPQRLIKMRAGARIMELRADLARIVCRSAPPSCFG